MRADLARYYPSRHLGCLFAGEMTPDECWDLVIGLPRDSATDAYVMFNNIPRVKDVARFRKFLESKT